MFFLRSIHRNFARPQILIMYDYITELACWLPPFFNNHMNVYSVMYYNIYYTKIIEQILLCIKKPAQIGQVINKYFNF